jgi:hypothetical protein
MPAVTRSQSAKERKKEATSDIEASLGALQYISGLTGLTGQLGDIARGKFCPDLQDHFLT